MRKKVTGGEDKHKMDENTAQINGVDWDMDESDEHASCTGLHDTHSQVDGDVSRDIAICGFSLKFPQDATSSKAFWEMMLQKRCAMTYFPADYLNPDGFYEGERSKPKLNTVSAILITSSKVPHTLVCSGGRIVAYMNPAVQQRWSLHQRRSRSLRRRILFHFSRRSYIHGPNATLASRDFVPGFRKWYDIDPSSSTRFSFVSL
jgi:hypothetical protein